MSCILAATGIKFALDDEFTCTPDEQDTMLGGEGEFPQLTTSATKENSSNYPRASMG